MVTSENQTNLMSIDCLMQLHYWFSSCLFSLNWVSICFLNWNLRIDCPKHIIASVQLTTRVTFGGVSDISVSCHFIGPY